MSLPHALRALPAIILIASLRAWSQDAPAPGAPAAAARSAPPAGAPIAPKPLVKIWVLAEGKSRKLVLDLQAKDFEIVDDRRPERVTLFEPRSEEPLRLGILIENSRGRLYEPDPAGWQAYSTLLHRVLRKGDRAFVATFAEKAQLLDPFTDNLAELDEDLKRAFADEPKGNTALYDSLATICLERFRGEPGRRALVVVSDTPDDFSTQTSGGALNLLLHLGVTVFPVLPWVQREQHDPYGDVKFAQLFADQTGGLFFLARGSATLAKQLEGVRMALDYSYTLGYVPEGLAFDGDFHAVSVKCKRAGVTLHANRGYFAPASP